MADHNDLGKEGEALALEYLKGKGYQILELNYRHHRDEADIIAMHGPEIVFVEVKTRVNRYAGNPEEAVTPAKQKRLVKLADAYIQEKDIDAEARFDIIGIIINQNAQEIKHIEDAFQPRW
jgi:putative endonuclease